MNKYLNQDEKGRHNHKESHVDKSNDLLKSLQDLPDFQKDIHCLSGVFQELFGTESLGNYCCYTDEGQDCTDGSDLYTLIKYHGKDLIVKVGAGEFNTKVFTTGNHKELKGFYMSPIPLFVVNQGDSYLGDEHNKLLRRNKPKEYLDAHAVLVSPKGGEAYYRTHKERHEKAKIDYTHLHVRHYDDVLATGRLTLLKKEFPGGEFSTAARLLKQLKELDFEKFYARVYRGEKFQTEEEKKLIGCLRHMGVNITGSAVGDRDAYQSVYDLIQTFDIQKEIFITPDKK